MTPPTNFRRGRRIKKWLGIISAILTLIGFIADVFGIRSAIVDFLGKQQFPKIITVSPNEQDGYQFTIKDAGIYTFKYIDGAYDVARDSEANDDWRTQIMLYIDNEIPRVGDDNKPDRSLAAGLIGGKYKHPSEDEAVAEAKLDSSIASRHLNKGDRVILVVSDKAGFYGDNDKGVRVEIDFVQDD